MVAVIGISPEPPSIHAAEWVARLWPEALEATLVHTVPSVLGDVGSIEGTTYPVLDLQQIGEATGRAAIARAMTHLPEGTPIGQRLRRGNPLDGLIDAVDEVGGDLVAVGSSVKDALGSLFLGSISRGIVNHSPVSVLVAKTSPEGAPQITAVFAIDHSAYSTQCIDELKRLRPTGIRRLIVMTANELERSHAGLLVHGLPTLAEKAEHWISERLRDENARIAAELAREWGAECIAEVRELPVNEAIDACAAEHQADLVIVGGLGHGLFRRMLLGSVSFHQASTGPHSVLVLRPRNKSEAP